MTDAPPASPIELVQDELQAEWARLAPEQVEVIELTLAGLGIRVELAGPALWAMIGPALELHPPMGRATPDITIQVLDCAATGSQMPTALGAIDPGVRWRSGADDHAVQLMWDGDQCAIADPAAGRHIVATADARRLPWWEQGAPLRLVLASALAPHDRWFVHAAAVGRPDGVVLLAAPSGHGKSSTAVSALLAGLHFLGDDLCILTVDRRVHALYGTVKVVPDDLPDLDPSDRLAAHVIHRGEGHGPHEDKTVAVASRVAPDLVLSSAPVVAVVVPSLDAPGGLEPISPATALRHLSPTTVLMLRSQGGRDLAAHADLVRRVPCHRLGLVPDRAANLRHLAQLLDDVVPVRHQPA